MLGLGFTRGATAAHKIANSQAPCTEYPSSIASLLRNIRVAWRLFHAGGCVAVSGLCVCVLRRFFFGVNSDQRADGGGDR